MIYLEVYLKNKPEVHNEVLNAIGLVQESNPSEPDGYLSYVWTSRVKIQDSELPGPENASIELLVPQKPSVYELGLFDNDEEVEKYVVDVGKGGFIIPPQFVDKLRRTKSIQADRETAIIYASYPQLSSVFDEYEPLWSLLELTDGLPCYSVSLRASIWGPKFDPSLKPTMRGIAQWFTDQFEGIFFDPQNWEVYKSSELQ